MAQSNIKKRDRTTGINAPLSGGSTCPHCPHLVSDHDTTRTDQCSKCACVAQDKAEA